MATLLADPEWGARLGAAEAAVELEAAVAVPLLRFKVLVGDAQPEVIGACWASLLQLAPDESVPAAAEALGARSDAESDAIALALGGSRLEAALEPLVAWSERASPLSRQAAFAAITLLRSDRGFGHLLDVVARGPLHHARDALRALGHFLYDARLAEQVRNAVATRGDPTLRKLLAELLPRDV